MSNTEQGVSALKGMVGETNVISDPDRLKAYSIDGLIPQATVFPGSIEEVSKVVAFANERKLSLAPRGSGTKMSWGALPRKVDLVLGMERVNRVTDSDIDNLTLSVECGMPLAEMQKRLAKEGRGYFIPLDPPFGSKATLGGVIATNATGPRRFVYGSARDQLLGLKAVLPNGDIVVAGGKCVKNVSGYDMTKLLIGSGGALGILCEITTRLLPLTEAEATLILPFKELEGAAKFVREIVHSKIFPAAIEVFNGTAMAGVHSEAAAKAPYSVVFACESVVEAVERQIAELGAMGRKAGAVDVTTLKAEGHKAFWAALSDFPLALRQRDPNAVGVKANVVLSKFVEIMAAAEREAKGRGFDIALVAQAGNGIVQGYLPVGSDAAAKAGGIADFFGRIVAEAVKCDGNCIVEAAPRAVKEKVNVWGQPRSDSVVMKRLKEKIDPADIMNTGRIVA